MLSSTDRHSRVRAVCFVLFSAGLAAFVLVPLRWQATIVLARKAASTSSSYFAPSLATPASTAHTPTVTDAATIEDMQTTSGLVVSRNPADGPEVTHFKIGNIIGGKVFKNDGTTEIPINTFITFEEGNAGLKFTPSPNNWGTLTFEVYSSTSNSDAGVGGIFARPNVTVQPLGDTPSVTNATTNRNTQSAFGLVVKRNPVDGLEINFVKITNIQNGTLFKHDGKTPINSSDFITFDEAGAGLKFTPANNLISPATTFSFNVQASATTSDTGIGGSAVTAVIGIFDPIFVTVNTLGDAADSNIGDGHCDTDGNLANGDQCTLRAAIEETNSAPADDTINFNLPANSTITLNTALPDLNSVTIAGPGASLLTVQRSTAGGTPDFRIITVTSDNTVNLSGLTISNGRTSGSFPSGSGGGILNNTGALIVSDSTITGNSALAGGGIRNLGTATLRNTTLSNNTATNLGGGISNSTGATQSAVMTIINCTISNNSSASGGGLDNIGTASVSNSTISTNSASTGGGINNFNPITLDSVTITGNSASNQGGGIYNPGIGTLTFGNTILAGNTSPTGPDASGANLISSDYNLIGNTAGGQFSGTTTHNLTNVSAVLGPLADNGGPTFTHAPLSGSPVIDAGNSGLTIDQRGQPRPVDDLNLPNAAGGNASDIGAYETPTFQVNSPADTDDGACTLPGTGNGCTLREAITAANSQAGADVITFAPALTSGGSATITLLTALPDLSSDMTITGPGANLLTVQRSSSGGTANFRIFTIASGKIVNISGLTISNGNLTGFDNPGGGVFTQGTLSLTNCNIYGNSAAFGGGIYSDGPVITLNNCNFGGTAAGQPNSGGGVYHNGGSGPIVNHGTLVMTGGSVVGNTGVGISVVAAATLNGVAIANNTSANASGGASVIGTIARADFINCLIANNSGQDGGGIHVGGSTVSIINTTISGNTASGFGGGIDILNATNVTLTNVTTTNNRGANGGGIAASGAVLLNNTIVAGNIRTPLNSSEDILNLVSSSSSFNLIGVCNGCGLSNGVNNNQVGVANPGLTPLADNGGLTLTHALLAGSPALDAGSNAFVTNPPFPGPPFTDQRGAGFSRIVDGPDANATVTVDIGAFEQQASLADITDQTTNEDVPLIISFDVGDPAQVTSITATSDNTALVPNNPANINVTGSSSTRTLTITPTGNMFGTSNITVTVNTMGGSVSKTFLLTVNSANDAPSFTKGPDQTVNEDAGAQTITNWATNMSPGPADESGQTLFFQVTNNTNAGLFSSAPAISTTGTLTYTPAANANGSAIITVVLMDNGGTANGGVNTSAPQTFTITVNPVNDAPTFTKGSNQTVNEDAGAQTVPIWATAISPGAANESGQILTFQITANNNSSLFASGPTVSSTGTLTYTPAANANGSANISIVLKDNGGTANGGADTSITQTFTITVNSVNDAPSFTKGSDQTVNEDAGAQTVANWASSISRGPANESVQSLTFTATNNNNALFSSQPAISATGTLTYTTAPDANGAATVSVTLKDNGGTANGGVDTSAPQTFTITVNAVNDAPSFTKGADQNVNNNVGAQTVINWATIISPGPSNESAQTVSFQVTGNNNLSLFAVAPAINSTGTLTYQPAANANGTAAITIALNDNGGTTNGGQDTSSPQTFNININPSGGSLKFNSASGSTTESSGSTSVTVTRTGDLSRAVTVDYATSGDPGLPCSTASGVASPKCDFTSSLGTLSFAVGESTKTITILISQDSFVEGPETFTVALSNQTGGSALATPAVATITINDDATEPPTNSIDDANNFVRQHYHDFLNREPDQSGLAFWTNEITSCGADQACIDLKRINVSAAFYISIEFQDTGYLVERIYKAAYGDGNGLSTLGGAHQLAVPIIRLNEFLPDTQEIGQGVIVGQGNWQQQLETNKQAFSAEFVQRPRFTTAFPNTMTAAQFVDKLNTNAGNPLSQSERDQLVSDLSTNAKTRAQVLRAVAEDPDLNTAEFNRAFVLMQYFGYLRRNPNDPQDTDYTGYDFWLTKLNQFNGNFVTAEMVKAFITSGEYRQRFGP